MSSIELILSFVERHPVWTLVYECVAVGGFVGFAEALARFRK